jgi:hypothetical protein
MSKKFPKLVMGCVAAGLAMGYASAAVAQARPTPKSWNYEIRDGKRVPKSERKVNDDGSWREEVRQGKCVTVKERTASGEYRETRRCD